MAIDLVTLKAGRPAVPRNSLEEVLNRFVQYDSGQRRAHTSYRPKGPFLDLMGRSHQWLRNYLRNQHLGWETLQAATDDQVLFYVVFGQRPFDITWASPSLHAALGYPFEEQYENVNGRKLFSGYASELINGRSAIDLLKAGHRPGAKVMQEVNKVRDDPTYVGHIERSYLTRKDGQRVPIEVLELRYTGIWLDRWVIVSKIIGEPEPSPHMLRGRAAGSATTSAELSKDENVFNVDDRAVLKLTAHNPQGLILNGADHVVIGGIPMTPPLLLQPAPTITTLNLTPQLTDQEMRDLYERLVPPYQYPQPDDDKKDDAE